MDPYVYPGTDILQNRRDIRDDGRLRTFEADASMRRLTELRESPLPGSFDANHLRQIHRYIFQDAYHWAGEFRTVNISRAGQFPYAFPNRIDGALNGAFAALRSERHLLSLDPQHGTY
jgi:cell filamentation protein